MAALNYQDAAHLLRRAAFGGSPTAIQKLIDRAKGSREEAVDRLLRFRPSRRRPPDKRRLSSSRRLDFMRTWWVKQMVRSRNPARHAQEKLALFWHDHLASGASKSPRTSYMANQNRLFRQYGKGDFKQLIREFNRDPANLYYLDGILNKASDDGIHVNANENWARELLELYTMGVFEIGADGTPDPARPNYSEDDVHQLARASTGWTSIDPDAEVGVFDPDDWDGGRYDDDGDDLPDDISIFGVTNNGFRFDEAVAGTSDDVLELIFSQVDADGDNKVAMFMAWKMWSWYAYPPGGTAGFKANVLRPIAQTFQSAGFEIEALLRALWSHDEFYSDAAKSRSVCSPADFVVQSLHAMDVYTVGRIMSWTGSMADVLEDMGMTLFEPPNVAGWPGGLAWITSSSIFERADFARDWMFADKGAGRIQFKRMPAFAGLLGDPAASPDAIVDAILHQLDLDDGVIQASAAQRQVLLDVITEGGTRSAIDFSSEDTSDVRYRVKGAIALALQLPENQIF